MVRGKKNENKNLHYKWVYIICHNKPITGIHDKQKLRSAFPFSCLWEKVNKYLTVTNEKKKWATWLQIGSLGGAGTMWGLNKSNDICKWSPWDQQGGAGYI